MKLPFVLGSEVSGRVAELGPGVERLQIGDRVVSTDSYGPYAEYCCAPVNLVALVPDEISSEVAAAALLKGLTARFLIN